MALGNYAWFHATRFTVQDPHSTLDSRSGIRGLHPPTIGWCSFGTVHQEMGGTQSSEALKTWSDKAGDDLRQGCQLS